MPNLQNEVPNLAVVLDGGVVTAVVVGDWPDEVPIPRAVCVDLVDHRHDPSGVRCHVVVDYGNSPEQALCLELPVVVSGSGQGAASGIEPSALLDQVLAEQRLAGVDRELTALSEEVSPHLDPALRASVLARIERLRYDLRGNCDG